MTPWTPTGRQERTLAPDAEGWHFAWQDKCQRAAVNRVPPGDSTNPAVRIGDAYEWCGHDCSIAFAILPLLGFLMIEAGSLPSGTAGPSELSEDFG